jgi:peptidoglycan/LPS O-acetylase OafA/YrhL
MLYECNFPSVHEKNFVGNSIYTGGAGKLVNVNQTRTSDHLPWLDGLRGCAAVWVLLSHIQILTGLKSYPILSWGSLAVDLFMILSGFLMAHHYMQRRVDKPWDSSKTISDFWIRRFFRIAPLYYVLLVIALLLGPLLGEYRSAIALVWPDTATPTERYYDQSFVNILSHMTFIFGLLPYFSFRSPLPDWSIGLEMQFYLVFPVIMFAILRIGSIKASLLVITLCVVTQSLFPQFFLQFPMPSFLPIKFYVFMIGIWIAISRDQKTMRTGFVISLSLVVIWVFFEKSQISVARVLLVISMFYLMNNGTLPSSVLLESGIAGIRNILSSRVSKFLGDTSYAVYLLHLIVLLPLVGEMTRLPEYQILAPGYRFLSCLIISIPIIYSLSWLLFNFVEKNGIKAGKAVLQAIKK